VKELYIFICVRGIGGTIKLPGLTFDLPIFFPCTFSGRGKWSNKYDNGMVSSSVTYRVVKGWGSCQLDLMDSVTGGHRPYIIGISGMSTRFCPDLGCDGGIMPFVYTPDALRQSRTYQSQIGRIPVRAYGTCKSWRGFSRGLELLDWPHLVTWWVERFWRNKDCTCQFRGNTRCMRNKNG